ncbi:vitamin K-dependent protein C-like [Aricia agestis]|uniref:vitamin K-dependent protein C-like n=1 Tax=Aricia agestis TaxID=91739 RepID=UPI001C201D78|nr:vitamin K-dependent protein C-like [Aricia agestis]
MTVNIKLLTLVCVLYSLHQTSSTRWCDKNQTFHREGVIGERGVFPWLGVLRVHIHQRNKFSVALTGIVLVKKDYAIASAQDISQVPRRHIIADSRAMFVVRDFTQWFCGVKGVTVHPDFEYNTFNSIALLHLTNSSSIPPICCTASSGKLVNQLYAMGYTDRNKILEKELYKINYVQPDLCGEFYNRVGFKQPLADEQEYVCGAAPTNRDHCRWDSGMVLASNTTGYWQLVGFGVGGPGCAAPARFISTVHYLPWIESVIEQNDPIYYNGYKY